MVEVETTAPLPTRGDRLDRAEGRSFGQVVRIGAAMATAGAGVLHLDAASDHTDHAVVVAFFVAVAVAQLGWAATAARQAFDRRTFTLGMLLNGAVLAIWMLSRTVGLPDLIAGTGGVEELGWKDAATSGLELVALAAGAAALVMPAIAAAAVLPAALGERVLQGMVAATLAITVPGVLVSHDPGDHGHAEAAHADGHPSALEVHDGEDPAHGHGDEALAAGEDPHLHSEVIDGHPGTADGSHGESHSLGSAPASSGAGANAHGDGAGGLASAGEGGDHGGDHGSAGHGGPGAGPVAGGPAAPDPLAGPGRVTTVRLGPFALLPQASGAELPHLSAGIPRIAPGELNLVPLAGIPPPCEDCYVLGLRPDLVYADGTTANLDTGPMLHHAVWADPKREDPVCGRDTAVGWLGHRVFASGNERTPFAVPDGFGIPVGRGSWTGAIELMNMSDELRMVYVELAARWVPRATPEVRPVTPVWLDIDSCGDSAVDVPAGVTDVSWEWRADLTGRILSAGGHLHDGGEWLRLTNESSGEHVCTSVAGYGTTPASMGTLDAMSGCIWDRLATVRSGDVLHLNAHYNTASPEKDVMGIMMIFVHETDDLAAGTPSPYPSEPPPDGAPETGHRH